MWVCVFQNGMSNRGYILSWTHLHRGPARCQILSKGNWEKEYPKPTQGLGNTVSNQGTQTRVDMKSAGLWVSQKRQVQPGPAVGPGEWGSLMYFRGDSCHQSSRISLRTIGETASPSIVPLSWNNLDHPTHADWASQSLADREQSSGPQLGLGALSASYT